MSVYRKDVEEVVPALEKTIGTFVTSGERRKRDLSPNLSVKV